MKKYDEIMQQYKNGALTADQARSKLTEGYKSGEISTEDANAGLKALGANYSFRPLTGAERDAKKQREDADGYIPAFEDPKPLPKTPDMRRRPDLAGLVVRQHTTSGDFDVHYDEDGYAAKSVRVR